ncbi:MAG: hypothetical protein D6748_10880 [Calditrichaeota bacterium]|nr:MAG: hypothetical protein D6748_10880 [Calditrichota bacterium]
MAGKIDGITPPFVPIGGVNGLPRPEPAIPREGPSFHDLLQEALQKSQDVRFSAHAQSRIVSRKIELDSRRVEKLVDAVNRAQAKGVHDSLILMDDLAFIVNIDNRTVVTVMDQENLKENIFTNIDSAIVVKEENEGGGIMT